ncbi:MAG: NINE protein [Candidatus Coproplasma sp.]
MTPNRVTVAFEKYARQIPQYKHSALRSYMQRMPDEYMDEFMFVPLKRKWLSILFSLLLGGIGVDRFYVGDVGLGVFKLIFSVVTVLCSSVPILGLILNIIRAIWSIADIFLCYKKVKELNYDTLSSFIGTHLQPTVKRTTPPVKKEEPSQEASVQVVQNTLVQTEQVTVQQPQEKPVGQEVCSQAVQSSPVQSQQATVQHPQDKPVVESEVQIDVIYHCKNCGQSMRIKKKAARYRCPKCQNIFSFGDVINSEGNT